jgi:hypothetical protein
MDIIECFDMVHHRLRSSPQLSMRRQLMDGQTSVKRIRRYMYLIVLTAHIIVVTGKMDILMEICSEACECPLGPPPGS